VLSYFSELRAHEFRRLDAHGEAYLDYTGSALYPESAVRWHLDTLVRGVFGNPHSSHGPSRASTEAGESARRAILAFLDADPDEYTVCFTANASAAVKLVAESFPFAPGCGLVLTADNHNSVNGIREFAARAGAPVTYVPLDADLRLAHAEAVLIASGAPGLFAFPAQSNFSGVRHPLPLVSFARGRGFDVLLDAAAFVPSHPISLREVPADFVAISLYKIIGYPTGVGALVARRDALARLARPWFAGGTVEYVSVGRPTFARRAGADAFEDGTADFLALSAVPPGLGFLTTVGVPRVSAHVRYLMRRLLEGVSALRHGNGRPVVRTYGPSGAGAVGLASDQGGTLALNVLTPEGLPVPCATVEARAAAARVSLRAGCFCNPGAAETAFGWPDDAAAQCYARARAAFSPGAFAQCLGPGRAAGALRLSAGLATNTADIDRAIDVIAAFRAP
jgi:selenocysteine lyase/cysteine desulfurase